MEGNCATDCKKILEDLRMQAQKNTQHIIGNGGKGLLERVTHVEYEAKSLSLNYVERGECARMRAAEFENINNRFDSINKNLDKLQEGIAGSKRLNLMIVGIGVSAIFSVLSLIVRLVEIGG